MTTVKIKYIFYLYILYNVFNESHFDIQVKSTYAYYI